VRERWCQVPKDAVRFQDGEAVGTSLQQCPESVDAGSQQFGGTLPLLLQDLLRLLQSIHQKRLAHVFIPPFFRLSSPFVKQRQIQAAVDQENHSAALDPAQHVSVRVMRIRPPVLVCDKGEAKHDDGYRGRSQGKGLLDEASRFHPLIPEAGQPPTIMALEGRRPSALADDVCALKSSVAACIR
jgi:hypothetical protein